MGLVGYYAPMTFVALKAPEHDAPVLAVINVGAILAIEPGHDGEEEGCLICFSGPYRVYVPIPIDQVMACLTHVGVPRP